jgi:chromosome partitioning protein
LDLVGVAEIAERLGVSKQVVTNWRTRKATFPKPVAELKSGPVWARETVLGWAADEGVSIPDEEPQTKDGAVSETGHSVVAALMNMKGGVGKSTMTANVGWYAAYYANRRVLLIDLDPQFNLSQYILGAKGYERLLEEGASTVEAIFVDAKGIGAPTDAAKLIRSVNDWDDGSCLHLLPASLELAWSMKYLADRAHMLRDYIQEVKANYDLILIDCSPTESILSTASYLASDFIFVPVKPEFLSTIGLPLLLRSIDEFKKTHKNEPVPEFGGIIFNDTGEKSEHDRSRAYVKDLATKHDLPVFETEVSHSDSYPVGARMGKPIFLTDNARSWKISEFKKVAQEFLEKVGL